MAKRAYKPATGLQHLWASGTFTHGDIAVDFVPSEFERLVEKLQLTEQEYVYSHDLRVWVAKHKDRRYVPEWLLDAWGLSVDARLLA